jgi:hypothetical protein
VRAHLDNANGGLFLADSFREVRITDSNLTLNNNHAGALRMNFKVYESEPLRSGRRIIITKFHILFQANVFGGETDDYVFGHSGI